TVTSSYDLLTKSLEVRVWDSVSGKIKTEPIKPCVNEYDHLDSAQFSADGKRIFTATRFASRIWDAATAKPLSELRLDFVMGSIHFSPDGKRIVTTSLGTMKVLDAQTGKPLITPIEHDDKVDSAQFS